MNIIKKIDNLNLKALSPPFKWTGGKRREIDQFKQFFPKFIINDHYKYVEPFIGGGAVYWYLNNFYGENIINDFDFDVVNFYKELNLSNKLFMQKLHKYGKISDHNKLQKIYYYERDKDKNNKLNTLSDSERAVRFFTVNQLAFSGMRRFNSSGEFNVPFGHYKGINTDVIQSLTHKTLLDRTEIYNEDFESIMLNNDTDQTFIFLDPPYTRVFKEYSSDNSFDEKDQKRLANVIKNIKNACVMMIINKSDFSEKLYKDMIKFSYKLNYGVNIKNRFSTAVEHLIICNY